MNINTIIYLITFLNLFLHDKINKPLFIYTLNSIMWQYTNFWNFLLVLLLSATNAIVCYENGYDMVKNTMLVKLFISLKANVQNYILKYSDVCKPVINILNDIVTFINNIINYLWSQIKDTITEKAKYYVLPDLNPFSPKLDNTVPQLPTMSKIDPRLPVSEQLEELNGTKNIEKLLFGDLFGVKGQQDMKGIDDFFNNLTKELEKRKNQDIPEINISPNTPIIATNKNKKKKKNRKNK